MGLEIERKFLVDHEKWKALKILNGTKIKQGFIVNERDRIIRVRISDEDAFITIKGSNSGLVRPEFEYRIPLEDANQLFELFISEKIFKTRYEVIVGSHLWEVDEFHDINEGLILAEIELEDENESFELPDWAVEEVTNDERYYNVYLIKFPFKEW